MSGNPRVVYEPYYRFVTYRRVGDRVMPYGITIDKLGRREVPLQWSQIVRHQSDPALPRGPRDKKPPGPARLPKVQHPTRPL